MSLFLDLVIIVCVLVTLGAVAVFVLQCMFWLSLIFGGGGGVEPEKDHRQDAYETYMKMKQDEFYLNNGFQNQGKKP
jgi:hypothetical protein